MKQFNALAHAHGLKVIEAPAQDLCSVSGTRPGPHPCLHAAPLVSP